MRAAERAENTDCTGCVHFKSDAAGDDPYRGECSCSAPFSGVDDEREWDHRRPKLQGYLPTFTEQDCDSFLPPDDRLDILYPGLCDDCAEKMHKVVKAPTVEAAADFDVIRDPLICTHTLPKRPMLITHVVRDLLCSEYDNAKCPWSDHA